MIDDYRQLFVNGTPLLDVRAPVEFGKGSFPGACNAPLLNNQERESIGIEYTEQGQQAAIELGEDLISGDLRDRRIDAWVDFARNNPDGALYCFRGGQRSRIAQRWLHESQGISYPRVAGGYKAMRQFLLQETERLAETLDLIIIGGRTGVGKTLLLDRLPASTDLEQLAWHRGSAFGRHATGQPAQIDFENGLAIDLIRHEANHDIPLAVENESRNVGSRHVPPVFHGAMSRSPLWLLEEDFDTRVDISHREYIVAALAEYQALLGEDEGWDAWRISLLDSLDRICRRLGGERHAKLRKQMESALQAQERDGDLEQHRLWIGPLLSEYYDPMYDYQVEKQRERIVFRGNAEEVVAEFQRRFG